MIGNRNHWQISIISLSAAVRLVVLLCRFYGAIVNLYQILKNHHDNSRSLTFYRLLIFIFRAR